MSFIFDIKVFLYNPFNVYISIAAVSLSLLFFLLLKFNANASNRQRLFLAYGHVFALVFPIIYFMYSTGCRMLFSSCDRVAAILYIAFMALASGLITAMIVAPFFMLKNFKKRSTEMHGNYISKFVSSQAAKQGISNAKGTNNVKVYLLESAKPIAFSFSHVKKNIFVSIGLVELLSRKELEAVLLHELWHIRENSPSLKITDFFMKMFSPFAKLASFAGKINEDEAMADSFATKIQHTARHVNSAKKKIEEFYNFG